MMLMPANNTGKVVKELYRKYPEKIGIINTPSSWKNPTTIKNYAIDNGCFHAFNESKYFETLIKSKNFIDPMFVVCPDVVGCHDRTKILWNHYSPMLKEMGFRIAFVAQDGCIPKEVPKEAYCCFIGGLDPWKDNNISTFSGVSEWTHVGRVNGLDRIKKCEEAGVDSVDGSGLWAKDYYKLIISVVGKDVTQLSIFGE